MTHRRKQKDFLQCMSKFETHRVSIFGIMQRYRAAWSQGTGTRELQGCIRVVVDTWGHQHVSKGSCIGQLAELFIRLSFPIGSTQRATTILHKQLYFVVVILGSYKDFMCGYQWESLPSSNIEISVVLATNNLHIIPHWINHKGGIVLGAKLWTKARGPIALTSRFKRLCMKCIDLGSFLNRKIVRRRSISRHISALLTLSSESPVCVFLLQLEVRHSWKPKVGLVGHGAVFISKSNQLAVKHCDKLFVT